MLKLRKIPISMQVHVLVQFTSSSPPLKSISGCKKVHLLVTLRSNKIKKHYSKSTAIGSFFISKLITENKIIGILCETCQC